MKFTDGFWLMRPGVHASHPAEVLDATAGPASLVVYAPHAGAHQQHGEVLGDRRLAEPAGEVETVSRDESDYSEHCSFYLV